MLNATTYSSKLSLAFSALDALFKSPLNTGSKKRDKKDKFLEDLLGAELHKKLYEKNDEGLRHRLTHGDYFSLQKDQENYLEKIYWQVINEFNKILPRGSQIKTEIKNPQRNPYDNKEGWAGWVETDKAHPPTLKELLEKCAKEGLEQLTIIERPIDY